MTELAEMVTRMKAFNEMVREVAYSDRSDAEKVKLVRGLSLLDPRPLTENDHEETRKMLERHPEWLLEMPDHLIEAGKESE